MPGSGQNINYQLRPAKSVERKIMCELIKEMQIIEGKNDLRYIGMGAKYFTDFLLFHNEFGITDMISIEAEKESQNRYEFNKPFRFIEMKYGTTKEILPQLQDFQKKMNIVWLDYDGVFSDEIMNDIKTLINTLYTGSMFFVSCNCSYRGKISSEKMESYKQKVTDYFDESIEKNQYTTNKIPFIIQNTINKEIEKKIRRRNRLSNEKINYMQLLFLTYRDGAPMMTIGGIIVNEELKKDINDSKLFDKLTYLSTSDKIFHIEIPKLTNKEIQLILKYLPITKEEYEEHEDQFYGITFAEIEKFATIYRYYPYYSEGILKA